MDRSNPSGLMLKSSQCCWLLYHIVGCIMPYQLLPLHRVKYTPTSWLVFISPYLLVQSPHFCWFELQHPPTKICPICSYIGTNWTPGNRGGHIIELTSWKEFSNVFYLFGGCYMGHPNMFVLNRDPLFTCFLKKWDFQSIYSWVPLLPRTPSHQHWWDPLHLHLCRFLQTRRWAMDRGVGRWGTDGKAEIG